MVKRLRRCPLPAESAVRFRMGLPYKNTAPIYRCCIFILKFLSGIYAANFVCRRSHSRKRILPRVSHLWETANSAYSDNIRCLFYVAPYAESTRQTKFAVVRIRVSESCRRTPACGKRQFDGRGLLRLQSKTKKVAFLSFRTDLQPFFNFLRPELYKKT